MKKVKSIVYNWYQVGNITDGLGEEYSKDEVGIRGVAEIIENKPCNGLEMWNYEICLEDGTSSRTFNPNYVEYFKQEAQS